MSWRNSRKTSLFNCARNKSETYHQFIFFVRVERLQAFQSHSKTGGRKTSCLCDTTSRWSVHFKATVQIVKLQVMQLHAVHYKGAEIIEEKVPHPLFRVSIESSINNTLAFFCLRFTLFTCRGKKKEAVSIICQWYGSCDQDVEKHGAYQSRPEWITSQFMPHKHSLRYWRGLWETKTICVTPTRSSDSTRMHFVLFPKLAVTAQSLTFSRL